MSFIHEIEQELRTDAVQTSGPNGAATATMFAENLSDVGNAARMGRIFNGEIKHSVALGWTCYDGKRWRRDDTQEIERRARRAVQAIHQEAADEPDKDRRIALSDWARKSENESRINAMIRLCESEPNVAVRSDIFDSDPMLFNCQNGTLDLRTGKLRAHRRQDYITRISPVDCEPDAPCVLWEKFLQKVLNDDFELSRYLQKVAGYSLTGDTREQEFYLLHGLGANGKTTFIKALLDFMGDYAVTAPVETFLVKRSGGIPNDLARLASARLVVASESEANQRLAESLVKALTGGERIAARFLHREFFEFEPSFKLILSTNHRPRIVGTDTAIWRRVRLVPFTVTIPPEEQDRELHAKLGAELPGILRWAAEGCLLWQRDGLKPPAAVTEASEGYRTDSDVLADFIAARCEIENTASVTASELYKAYVEWCEEQKDRDRDRLSRVTFGQALAERGFVSERRWNGRCWRGIKLTEARP